MNKTQAMITEPDNGTAAQSAETDMAVNETSDAESQTESSPSDQPAEALKRIRATRRGAYESPCGDSGEFDFIMEGCLTMGSPAEYPIGEMVETAIAGSAQLRELNRLKETAEGYQRRAAELRGELDRLEARLTDLIRAGEEPRDVEARIAAIPAEISSLNHRIEVLKEPTQAAALKVSAFARQTYNKIRNAGISETESAYKELFTELCSDGKLPALIAAYLKYHNLAAGHQQPFLDRYKS